MDHLRTGVFQHFFQVKVEHLVFYDFRKSFFFAALDNQWALVVD
jgi:hypothetical protein